MLAVAGWVGALVLIANLGAIGLRPLWLINNHSVVITLFLPASLLAAFAARQFLRWLGRWSPPPFRPALRGILVLLFVLLACYGAWQFRDVIIEETNLTAAPDLPALAWAAEHTPPDARFLVNAVPWLDQVYRGADAGWWLLPLAGRWTSTPPVLYTYGSPEYVAEVTQRSAAVASIQPGQPAQLDRLIRANRITHIFIGARGGPLKADMFRGRLEFKPVYDQGGVMIFEVQHH
ncbi:MAG: hypothetical protein M3380_09645 [Chloroflexota bacterium]|nr:hypothetical protein [Chloroflexota bacterium]